MQHTGKWILAHRGNCFDARRCAVRLGSRSGGTSAGQCDCFRRCFRNRDQPGRQGRSRCATGDIGAADPHHLPHGLNGLSDTSVLLRIPAAGVAQRRPISADQVRWPGDWVACEPMVSVLTEVAKQLHPAVASPEFNRIPRSTFRIVRRASALPAALRLAIKPKRKSGERKQRNKPLDADRTHELKAGRNQHGIGQRGLQLELGPRRSAARASSDASAPHNSRLRSA